MSSSETKQVVYQANPSAVQTIKSMKDHLHKICKQHANRPVRVQTVEGITYEGVLSHTDGGLLFLVIPGQQTGKDPDPPPYGPYNYGQGQFGGYSQQGYPGQFWNYGQQPGYPGPPVPTPYGSPGYPPPTPYGSGEYGYTPYSRGLFGSSYYNNVILPLVLYELLVISLLA
ncbi:hypothetical protein MKX50_08660 [Paenibacillus sp. FSL W8-0186]|uniref:Uncharacterized protein n=1 Tax=Paenibacillus woosongensis TaxID=307580 RepID=A0ABQ4MLT3_9BACL|nr:hypothetical protein [Paenibacillus woosongensis]GIP56945.1 hypothetical protein J15TS10_07590 [Paenibacillus woosongensis]